MRGDPRAGEHEVAALAGAADVQDGAVEQQDGRSGVEVEESK